MYMYVYIFIHIYLYIYITLYSPEGVSLSGRAKENWYEPVKKKQRAERVSEAQTQEIAHTQERAESYTQE